MRYLYCILTVLLLSSCTTNSDRIVVPISTFSITLAGHSYNEQSSLKHPIKATIITGTDKTNLNAISIASLAVISPHINLYFAGENNNAGYGTGSYFVGIRNAQDVTECPYQVVDIAAGNVVYSMDTFSTFSINTYSTYNISGTFKLNLWNGGNSYTATGSFSYSPYFGKL